MRIGSLWPNFLQISHIYVFYNHKHLYIDIGPFVRYSCISQLSSYFEILHRSQGYHPQIRFVSIYQQLHCLFSRFLRQTAMKISKLRIIDPSRDKSIGDWCILFCISKLASQHYAEINRWAMNQIFSRNRCLSPQCLIIDAAYLYLNKWKFIYYITLIFMIMFLMVTVNMVMMITVIVKIKILLIFLVTLYLLLFSYSCAICFSHPRILISTKFCIWCNSRAVMAYTNFSSCPPWPPFTNMV